MGQSGGGSPEITIRAWTKNTAVTVANTSDMGRVWALFRMLPPVWFDAEAVT